MAVRVAYQILAVFMMSLPAWAREGIPCLPQEPYQVCVLEAQRNNALNDLANIAGEQDRAEKAAAVLAEWWRSYVAGVEAQRQEAQQAASAGAARAAEAARPRGR